MKTLTDLNNQKVELNNIIDNVLKISKYKELAKELKKYIKKNYNDLSKVRLIFRSGDDGQKWIDFSFDSTEGKFNNLGKYFQANEKLFKDSETYLNDVSTINLLNNIERSDREFPFESIDAFKNKIRFVWTNRLKTKEYNITTYLIEI